MHQLSERLASLDIVETQFPWSLNSPIPSPLKPPNIIVLWCLIIFRALNWNSFQGPSLIMDVMNFHIFCTCIYMYISSAAPFEKLWGGAIKRARINLFPAHCFVPSFMNRCRQYEEDAVYRVSKFQLVRILWPFEIGRKWT